MFNDDSLNKHYKKASCLHTYLQSICYEIHRSFFIFVLWSVSTSLDFIPLSSFVPCLWQDNGEVICPAVTVNTGFSDTSSHTCAHKHTHQIATLYFEADSVSIWLPHNSVWAVQLLQIQLPEKVALTVTFCSNRITIWLAPALSNSDGRKKQIWEVISQWHCSHINQK